MNIDGFFNSLASKTEELYNYVAPEMTDADRLFAAVQSGDLSEYHRLVSMVGTRVKSESGNSLLHVACRYGRSSLVAQLTESGLSVSDKGQGGNTCLHFACIGGHASLAKTLISMGASAAAKNSRGQTCYDVAVGASLKQYLMPLIFAEEERLGIAPVMAGVSRDESKDAARLANLPPPPTNTSFVPSTYAGGRFGPSGFEQFGAYRGQPPQQQRYSSAAQLNTSNASFSSTGSRSQPRRVGFQPPPAQTVHRSVVPADRSTSPRTATKAPAAAAPRGAVRGPPPSSSSPYAAPQQQQRATPPQQQQQQQQQQRGGYVASPFGGAQYAAAAAAAPATNDATYRPIQADGFVTTVGNPELAARYGNSTQSRVHE